MLVEMAAAKAVISGRVNADMKPIMDVGKLFDAAAALSNACAIDAAGATTQQCGPWDA